MGLRCVKIQRVYFLTSAMLFIKQGLPYDMERTLSEHEPGGGMLAFEWRYTALTTSSFISREFEVSGTLHAKRVRHGPTFCCSCYVQPA